MLPHVLIVDNDSQTLDIMKLYLKGVARVSTVLGGMQAINFVHQNKVDIILLDIEMPVMDGFATLEQLRKLEECINVPVILVTGRTDKTAVYNSYIMGVDGYLAKPVSKPVLIEKVTEVYQKNEKKRNRKTILMIDDDMLYLKQLNNMLQEDYNVVMINSAKLALNYLHKNTPHVILLDYQMPLYNGANLMAMMQKNNSGRQIPTIILSGTLDSQALQECYRYKPAAFLTKPVSKEDLIVNIENALNQ